MVIVILGILAATALPKFVDLSGQAQDAANEGALGALRSAATILYAENAANGSAAWPTGTQLAEGMEPAGTCDEGDITLPGFDAEFGTGEAGCSTAIAGPSAIVIN